MSISSIQTELPLNEQTKQLRRTGPKGAWRHTELEVITALRILGNASCKEVSTHLSLHPKWVGQKITLLHRAGRIYISGWGKSAQAGDYFQIYAICGDGEDDEVKPTALSAVQRSQEYRVRRKLKELIYHGKQSL